MAGAAFRGWSGSTPHLHSRSRSGDMGAGAHLSGPASEHTAGTPVGVWLTQFKPFALASADQFLVDIPPPPPLKSTAWAINFNLTKTYGEQNSTVRTAAQTEIGRFWTDDAAAQYSRAFRAHDRVCDGTRQPAWAHIRPGR